jgi:hypothetical protein
MIKNLGHVNTSYREVKDMAFKVSWKTHFTCLILAVFIAILLNNTINNILEIYFELGLAIYPTPNMLINVFVQGIAIMLPITLIHEFFHGLAYTVFDGKVRFGFKGIYVYTQEVSGRPIQRTKFLVVLLSPLTVISLITLILPDWLGCIIFILNLLGSTGDIYMALYLCRFDSESCILDRSNGFEIVNCH